MIDVFNFIVGCVSSFVLGMAFHSVIGHYCENRWTGVCRFFHHGEGRNVKKMFSENKKKAKHMSSKEPIQRPIVQANHENNLRIIPLRINLKFRIEPKDQRAQYVELLNMMINKLETIINGARTRTTQRLRAMQLLTTLIQTSYTIVRDVDIEDLEQEIEAIENDLNDTS
jgi:hypothetical protein